jgi:hypothetical protein
MEFVLLCKTDFFILKHFEEKKFVLVDEFIL